MRIDRFAVRTATALAMGSLAVAGLAEAQDRQRLPRECRKEIVKLCGRDRSAIRECLREKYTELSDTCSAELRARIGQMRGEGQRDEGRQAQGIAPQQELSYGTDPLQTLDFYPAKADGKPAPLVLFVHGGGWKRGDKSNATGASKAAHYTGEGYNFASIDYRLVPNATVEQQAGDVAASLGALLHRADELHIDRSRVVLMGHSAGAHLVALVGTDPQYLRAAGLSYADVSGVIPLDGAAYDVPAQMGENAILMGDTYKQAFGTDPERQKRLSPTFQAAAPNAPAFLILHVERPDGTRQSNELGAALRKSGADVTVRGFPGTGLQGHAEINRRMGDPGYPATPVVDRWLAKVFAH